MSSEPNPPAFTSYSNTRLSGQSSSISLEINERRKRRRTSHDYKDLVDADPENASDSSANLMRSLAVGQTDPFHVAGASRSRTLPGGTFPHATNHKRSTNRVRGSISTEMALLKPPLYVVSTARSDRNTSLRRRHMDNLAALLHVSLLRSDWSRAFRIWALLTRTPISGRFSDIRQNGRWMTGAELLMRRERNIDSYSTSSSVPHGQGGKRMFPSENITNQSLSDARRFYDHLILQYPNISRASHTGLTAKDIYPCLFNVWIYAVQALSKRDRKHVAGQALEVSDIDQQERSRLAESQSKHEHYAVRSKELDEAKLVAHRLDELVSSPPYDTSPPLIILRGMVSLWVAFLHHLIIDLGGDLKDKLREDSADHTLDSQIADHRREIGIEHTRARHLFGKMIQRGTELPDEALAFLREDDGVANDTRDDQT